MKKTKKTQNISDIKKRKYICIGIIIILVILVAITCLYCFLSNRKLKVACFHNNANESIEPILEDKTWNAQKNIL